MQIAGVPKDLEDVKRKLKENAILTGKERLFLYQLVQSFENSGRQLKRNSDSDGPATKNKKVQADVDMKQVHNISSQTEPYIEKLLSNKNKPGTSKDNIFQCKQLTKQEKVDPAKAHKLMDEGFDTRRAFILVETPAVAMVKERYSLLFTRSETINELDRITNAGRCDDFMNNIAGYAQSILGMQPEDDTILLRTLEIANEAVTLKKKLYALEVGALLMISPLVEDRLDNFWNYLHLNDFEITPSDDTSYPYIKTQATFEDLFYNKHSFSIFVEDIVLCEVNDFREAMLCLLASYFIFNVSYNPTNRNTLVFMERVFLEEHDTCLDSDEDRNLLQHIQTVLLKKQAKYKLPLLKQR